MSGTETAGKKKKWLIGLGVFIVLAIVARFIEIPESDQVIAERAQQEQQLDTIKSLTILPASLSEKGFKRDVTINKGFIFILDTATENTDIDYAFAKSYSAQWVEAIVKDMISAGINPRKENISIEVMLGYKGPKSVTGKDQTLSYGHARYDAHSDKIDWIDSKG